MPGVITRGLGSVTDVGTPPTVTIISPTVGTNITPTTHLNFNVTSTAPLTSSILYVQFSGSNLSSDVWEVAHNGVSFSPEYAASSSMTPITGGFNYNLLRTGGWVTSQITLAPYVVDVLGAINP